VPEVLSFCAPLFAPSTPGYAGLHIGDLDDPALELFERDSAIV
jgi:hypothetical protein